MHQIHGVADVQKLDWADSATQRVEIEDGPGYVIVRLAYCSFPAGLTPEEARFIAKQLIAAADRVKADPANG